MRTAEVAGTKMFGFHEGALKGGSLAIELY